MKKPGLTALKNLDYIVLSTPLLLTGAAASGCGLLESKKSSVLKTIGYLGNRLSVITFALAGIPLLIYTLAKAVLFKTLYLLTFQKVYCFKQLSNQADNALKIFLVGYGGFLMLLANIPTLIAMGRSIKQVVRQSAQILENLNNNATVVAENLKQIILQVQHDLEMQRQRNGNRT